MKRIILTIAAMAIAAASYAQISVGAGYLQNTSKSTYTSGSTTTTSDPSTNKGFYVGADYKFYSVAGVDLTAGAKLSYLSNSDAADVYGIVGGTAKLTELYIGVPVMASYGIDLGPAHVFAFAGPTVNFGISSNLHSTLTVLGKTTESDTNMYGDSDGDSNYKRLNIMLGAGVGADILDMVRVKVGYDLGLLNRTSADNSTLKENQFYVGVAYLF